MKNKIAIVSLVIVLIISLSCFAVGANAKPQQIENLSLTVEFVNSDKAFQNAKVEIYKIADISPNYDFYTTQDFSSYQVDISKDKSNYPALSQTLSAYIALDKIEPTITLKTDKNSKIIIPDIEWGLYLIEIDNVILNNELYTAQPALVAVPFENDDKSYIYKVKMQPKTSSYESGFFNKFSDKMVIKKWEDDRDKSFRPNSVTVALLENGEVYDTVNLSESNNWQHSWKNLNNYSNWQVVEIDVDKNYTALVENESFVFELTNKLDTGITQETEPTTSSSTQSTEPTTSSSTQSTEPTTSSSTQSTEPTTSSSTQSTEPTTQQPEKLPQTGTTMWLIPILSIVGLCLIILGIFIKTSSITRRSK